MFSGIVEHIGKIENIIVEDGCKHFSISHPYTDLIIGESIAINGVCLTVTSFQTNLFNVSAVPETLRLTNLDILSINAPINLERSVQVGGRIGGHYVQGHVDCVGKIIDIKHDNSSALLAKIATTKSISKYIVPKGYITLDGMSITVINTGVDWFTVTFIPHTQVVTITNTYQPGSLINIEVDIMGKYVEKSLGAYLNAANN